MGDVARVSNALGHDETMRSRHNAPACRQYPVVAMLAVMLAVGCASSPPPAELTRYRVLVYNIHAGRDAAEADNLERVAAIVKMSGADVVLLQEVDRRTERSGRMDQVAELERLTGFDAAFGKTLDYQGGEYGIALLSRWPIVRDTLVRLAVSPPQQRAGGSYEPRGALRASIAAPNDTLFVVNTHIDASEDDQYRRQEMAGLLAIVDSLRSRRGAVLLGGDLNATPESEVIRMALVAGVRDAWLECGQGPGLTYPASLPVKRIDYLMIVARADCEVAVVIESQASDHRGVLFTIVAR
jgi:endonuclease/exonuclease/phosphatase family metal-dependent hydrolase